MLDKNGLAEKDMKMHVFHFNHENEFTSSSYIKIESGTGLPGNSTLVQILDMKDGFTQVFNEVNQSWEYVEDHRYTEIYNIHTQQKEEVNYIGPLKSEHTTVAPPSYYHEFINGEWIITDEKQAEIDAMQKQQRINELELEKEKVSTSMIKNGFLGNAEEAKADAIRLEEIETEIKKLKE